MSFFGGWFLVDFGIVVPLSLSGDLADNIYGFFSIFAGDCAKSFAICLSEGLPLGEI